MDITAVYIILGVLIGIFTLILIAVSAYFIVAYRKGQSETKKKKRRANIKKSESAAGNYFQAGTFRLPGKASDPPEQVYYDNAPDLDIEQGQHYNRRQSANSDSTETRQENEYNTNLAKEKALDYDNDWDKDSGKGTASVEGDSEGGSPSDDVTNDLNEDDVISDADAPIRGIAHVDEVGVDLERTDDPEFVSKEKQKIKNRAEQVNIIHGRGYAPRYRRKGEPLEPLFEFGEEESAAMKSSYKAAREVFNY